MEGGYQLQLVTVQDLHLMQKQEQKLIQQFFVKNFLHYQNSLNREPQENGLMISLLSAF